MKNVKGLRSTPWWLQNSHRDAKDSLGKIVNNILITLNGAGAYWKYREDHFINYIFIVSESRISSSQMIRSSKKKKKRPPSLPVHCCVSYFSLVLLHWLRPTAQCRIREVMVGIPVLL